MAYRSRRRYRSNVRRKPHYQWVRSADYLLTEAPAGKFWGVNLLSPLDNDTDAIKAPLIGSVAKQTDIPVGARVERIIGRYTVKWSTASGTMDAGDTMYFGVCIARWLSDAPSLVGDTGAYDVDTVVSANTTPWMLWDTLGHAESSQVTNLADVGGVPVAGDQIVDYRFDIKSARLLKYLGDRPWFSAQFGSASGGAGPSQQFLHTSTLLVLP